MSRRYLPDQDASRLITINHRTVHVFSAWLSQALLEGRLASVSAKGLADLWVVIVLV